VRIAERRNLGSSFDEKAMNASIKDFSEAAERLQKLRRESLSALDKSPAAAQKLKRINDVLIAAERGFIDPRGLQGRSWYKHEIYAPGIYTGYAAQPLTDFRQALDDRNGSNAREGLNRVIEAIRRVTETLKSAE
jgi:N-acetylated-alpha-linked acidic dipeptidase